jgi:protein phosphatase
MYYCCGITEKGVMPHNEDALLIGRRIFDMGSDEQTISGAFTAAVSDGVSGENSGELASKMCLERLKNADISGLDTVEENILAIHHELKEYSKESEDDRNMQTTLCGVHIDDSGAVTAFNVGDSRLYSYQFGRLRQISKDQSLVQMLIERGGITASQSRTHIRRNIIFPVIGSHSAEPKVDVSVMSQPMECGDMLLLCTDGLSDHVPAMDIQEILDLPKPLPERLSLLVQTALERRSNDNISIIAILRQE